MMSSAGVVARRRSTIAAEKLAADGVLAEHAGVDVEQSHDGPPMVLFCNWRYMSDH